MDFHTESKLLMSSVINCHHTVVKNSVGSAVPAFKQVLYWKLGSIVPDVARRADILLSPNQAPRLANFFRVKAMYVSGENSR